MRLNLQRHTWRAMGSRVDLLAVGAPTGAVSWAIRRVRELEQCWSRFRPDSDLCRLNAASGSGAVPVPHDLADAVDRSVRLWRATDGRFDPAVLGGLESLGYDETFRRVRRRPVDSPQWPALTEGSSPGVGGVVVDHERGTVELPAGVRLDLGGLGKGLAADLVADGLIERGARGVCVSVGGDVSARGEPAAGGTWSIPVVDPHAPGAARWRIPVTSGAVVQSTTLIRRWQRGTEAHHHLIDPSSGRSADTGVVAVVAVAAEAWWAEGVAKAALIAGRHDGGSLLWSLADGGFLVEAGGGVVAAPDTRLCRTS